MYGGLLLTRWAQKFNFGRERDKGSLPPPPTPPSGVRMRCVRDEGNQGLYSGHRVIDLPTRRFSCSGGMAGKNFLEVVCVAHETSRC